MVDTRAMQYERSLQSLSDDELLASLTRLLGSSRSVESEIVAHIAEVERRRLYARAASPSMFVYCTSILHLSEAEAYLRIRAARASRRFPIVLAMLADGRLHLSGLAKLSPCLTRENGEALLARAVHRSKREIEGLVAEVAPRPDVPATVRRLPVKTARPQVQRVATPEAIAGGPGSLQANPVERGPETPGLTAPQLRPDAVPSLPLVEALSPSRYRVQFTASADLRDKLERLKGLMRSEVPDGDLAAIIERAVTEKLERLEARRQGRTTRPRTSLLDCELTGRSRHVPAALKRAVCARDGNRCRYVDDRGRRCPETQG